MILRRWRSYEMLRIVMNAARVMMLAERAVMSGGMLLKPSLAREGAVRKLA